MLSIMATQFSIFNSNFHFVWIDNNNSMVDKLSINLFIRMLNFSDSTASSQGGNVVHQGHCAGVKEAEVLDGPEEGTVCLHCEVPQVKVVFPKILNQ